MSLLLINITSNYPCLPRYYTSAATPTASPTSSSPRLDRGPCVAPPFLELVEATCPADAADDVGALVMDADADADADDDECEGVGEAMGDGDTVMRRVAPLAATCMIVWPAALVDTLTVVAAAPEPSVVARPGAGATVSDADASSANVCAAALGALDAGGALADAVAGAEPEPELEPVPAAMDGWLGAGAATAAAVVMAPLDAGPGTGTALPAGAALPWAAATTELEAGTMMLSAAGFAITDTSDATVDAKPDCAATDEAAAWPLAWLWPADEGIVTVSGLLALDADAGDGVGERVSG